MNTSYRKYKKGDTVSIVGFNNRLYNGRGCIRELAPEHEFGVTCVLQSDEDHDLEVGLPLGILADNKEYVHISCIALVEPVESKLKSGTVEYDEDNQCFRVYTHDNGYIVASIYRNCGLSKELAEKLANDIKAAYDKVINA